MTDPAPLDQRLAALSPQRRQLLDKLRGAAAEPPAQPSSIDDPARALRLDTPASIGDTKRLSREFYDNVSLQLDGSPLGEHALFLNYGYVSTAARDDSPIALPARALNRNAVKLVLEVIGAVGLDGLDVLDVGCGRGGTADVVHRYFRPHRFVGLDLSPQAVRFCRGAHRHAGFSFFEGDAEQLPFADAEFDIVINIESSHNYPDAFAFYRGVVRVLRTGGRFLHTDNVSAATWDAAYTYLRGLGLRLEHERDITANVLRSCDETAGAHRQAFQPGNDACALDTFLAVPGSPIYDDMKQGKSAYRICRWAKPE